MQKLSGSGTQAQFISATEVHEDQRTAQVFGPCNEDFAPPEGCKTINIPLGRGRGFLVSVAYHNQAVEPVAQPGEKRIFSTGPDGSEVMAEVYLKQDGTALIKNAIGRAEIKPDGQIDIANAQASMTILPSGEIVITGAGQVSVQSAEKIVEAATAIEMNGAADNLVMWSVLNAQLQALVAAFNAHTHAAGTVPAPDPPPFVLDISGARANTLKTSG